MNQKNNVKTFQPKKPKKNLLVSIGMPVYNGEKFIEQALESMVSQTLRDIEIVISDNCSTDLTSEICRAFAANDDRIIYLRQPVNFGAGPNYNFVFHRSRGKYFKWATHDDYMDKNALELCVNVLEKDSQVVLAHPMLVDVDVKGKVMTEFDRGARGLSLTENRFWSLIDGSHNCAEIFGVIRSEALRRTKLIRDYTDSDRTLLGELSLLGKIFQVSNTHFYRRRHPGQSANVFVNFYDRAVWFNPKNRNKVTLSAWTQVIDWLSFVIKSPLSSAEKCRCIYLVLKMAKWRWQLHVRELQLAIRHSCLLISKQR